MRRGELQPGWGQRGTGPSFLKGLLLFFQPTWLRSPASNPSPLTCLPQAPIFVFYKCPTTPGDIHDPALLGVKFPGLWLGPCQDGKQPPYTLGQQLGWGVLLGGPSFPSCASPGAGNALPAQSPQCCLPLLGPGYPALDVPIALGLPDSAPPPPGICPAPLCHLPGTLSFWDFLTSVCGMGCVYGGGGGARKEGREPASGALISPSPMDRWASSFSHLQIPSFLYPGLQGAAALTPDLPPRPALSCVPSTDSTLCLGPRLLC